MSTPSDTVRPIIGIDASRANAPHRTGVEWYAYHVIQQLKSIIPQTYRVRLYSRTPLRDGLEELPPHWEARIMPLPSRFWTQLRLTWEVLRRPPDALFVPAHVLPMWLPKHSITTVHDIAFMTERGAYTPHGGLYLRYAAWHAVRHASRILTVSEFSKQEIVRHFDADPARIIVTPLAHDPLSCHPVDAEARASALASHGVAWPYFLFVGRLEQKKNIGAMIDAFRRCKERWPDRFAEHRFVLIGKPGKGYRRERAQGAGSGERGGDVVELGYVPPEDMAALLSGATALMFATRYEGFGIPMLEAMACGTPVIASRATASPEVGGDAALYVDHRDPDDIARAMHRLVADTALHDELASRGLAHVGRFSWRRTAEMTWEAIREVVARV